MAFYIIVREIGNKVRVADYRMNSRSKAENLTNHMVKARGYNPIYLCIVTADTETEALELGKKHFNIK